MSTGVIRAAHIDCCNSPLTVSRPAIPAPIVDEVSKEKLLVSSAALRDGILAVPVIDISSFRMPYADAAARSQVVRQVDEAARTVGFMQITGHGIARATRIELTNATDAFFALDPETKQKYRCPPGI